MSRIDDAFEVINRADFLPAESKNNAYADAPIPIGYGQTNSQPTTVRLMLEWLDPLPGQKILDVGSGSGWTTALLAHLADKNGEVYAVEKVPELVDTGRDNCDKAGIANARFFAAGKDLGLPDFAPFDRILVSAAANAVPKDLLDQLEINGRLVIPVKTSILIINKIGADNYETEEHAGFMFVPLI